MILFKKAKTVNKYQDKHSQLLKICEVVKQSSRNGRKFNVVEIARTVNAHQDKHSHLFMIGELVKQSSRNGRKLIVFEIAKTVNGHSNTLSYTDWISDRCLSSRFLRKFINVETSPLSLAEVSSRPPLLSKQDCALNGRAESKRTRTSYFVGNQVRVFSFLIPRSRFVYAFKGPDLV